MTVLAFCGRALSEQEQTIQGPYETDGPLVVRGLLTVHGPLRVGGSITVRFGRQNIRGTVVENRNDAPEPSSNPAKTIDGPLTVNGPLTVHGSLTADGLTVDGPVIARGRYREL